MFDKTIEDLVRENVLLTSAGNGWHRCICKVCGGGVAQTPRGNWRFEGDICNYNCYNCFITGTFNPDWEYPITKGMITVLNAYGIPEKEYWAIAYGKRILEGTNKEFSKPSRPKVEVKPIEVPDYFYKLIDGNPDNVIVQNAVKELRRRNINPDDYTFYLSNGKSKGGPKEEAMARVMMNRLIIPFFNPSGELIYYQGRSLDLTNKKRYINADMPKGNIIYGMDQLNQNINSPLYVTEGFFDAYHLRGVSIQQNSLSSMQIELLNRSPRTKVWVPDKGSDSSKTVDQFIELGWKITVPDIGSSCKDIDDSIRKYGKLYTFNEVANNVFEASDAKILMKLKGYL